MYSMWNNSFSTVKLFLETGNVKCSPLMFHTSDRGVATKFKIEELDALTSRYEDEEHFCKQLLSFGDTYIKNEYKNIIITHTKNGMIYQDDPIYNDQMIRNMSNEIRVKKQKNTSKDKILLSNNDVLLEFIGYIKGLALNDNSYPYLLEPDFISQDISDYDKKNLRFLIKDDLFNSEGKIIYRGLRGLLSEYRLDYNAYMQCLQTGESIDDAEKDLSKVEEKINYAIRSDYRTLRNLVAWENRYLKILQKQKDSSKTKKESKIFLDLIQEVMIQKKFRNGKVSYDDLDVFYHNKEILEEYTSKKETSAEDEDMLVMYQQGGIDEVMKNIDIDDIYGSSIKYQTAVKLGIVKAKK